MDYVRVSKFLALHLRHHPERIGISLDRGGWVDVDVLLDACVRAGVAVNLGELRRLVAGDGKRRYSFDDSGRRIRANQGHSVDVDLELPAVVPPGVLYHGTVARFVAAIRRDGLLPMGRHDVHLSADRETAAVVGARRGEPVVLVVDAAAMVAAGHLFRLSVNGVWLTPAVPPAYLR